MIITLLLLIIFVLLARHYIVQYSRNGRLINRIPGPKTYPIFGNTLQVFHLSVEDLWNIIRSRAVKYYPILRVWCLTSPYVSICHPDDIETILSSQKHLEKGYIYSFLLPWLSTGLLISPAPKWHKRRKILTPTFHFNILKQFVDILIEEGDRMTKSLKNSKGPVIKELMYFISQHTLNAICETAMGTSLKDMGTFEKQYREAVHGMGAVFLYRLMRPWFHNNILFALTPMGRAQTKYLKILHGFTDKIIAERKRYHENTNGRYLTNLENDTTSDDMDVIGVRKKRLAMLDLLIAVSHENQLSDVDIREEVDTFMFEGHDTVAMSLCFTLLLLAEHKDIQDRIRNEVSTVIKENGGKLTMTGLNKLSYLERCLKESLRLYPSVPFVARMCAEDVKLQSYIVPAGTPVHLNIFSLHRDPNFWPNPDVFDPDRFIPEKIQNRHPYSYVPFSAGPRNCIGQRFAMLELKAVVASLVHNFYLEPVDYLKDLRFMTDIIIRVSHPFHVKFVPIDTQ